MAERWTTNDIEIYGWGLIYCSACVPSGMTPQEAEQLVNRKMPSGTSAGWNFHGESFSSGQSNPSPCELNKEARQHVLFSC